MSQTPPRPPDVIDNAYKDNDPRPLAALSKEELEKLRLAEEILEARFHAKKRANRLATVGATLVGYVALAGFFANAYQNFNNKKHLEEQARQEAAKWKLEFDRSSRADKYRAFFETSALVTDPQNSDRRLIGYALLEEFVADPDYHRKAVVILEESLAKELAEETRDSPADGLSSEHRAAVSQIVQTLSASPSCTELIRAARSIDKVVGHAKGGDVTSTQEIFTLYARRLMGRAALICKEEKDFDAVRQPIRDSLSKMPAVVGLSPKPQLPMVNAALSKLLVDRCVDEVEETGTSDCPDIRKKYVAFCAAAEKDAKEWPEEKGACDNVRNWPEPTVAEAHAGTDEQQPQ